MSPGFGAARTSVRSDVCSDVCSWDARWYNRGPAVRFVRGSRTGGGVATGSDATNPIGDPTPGAAAGPTRGSGGPAAGAARASGDPTPDLPGAASNPPAGESSPSGGASHPPSLRAQIAAVIAAARRLLTAHIELARAEAGEIMGEVGRVAMLGGLALAMVLLAGVLLPVGLVLFLGEWIFGSIGWGVLLGSLLLADIAIVAVLGAVGVPGSRLGRAFLFALLMGVAVGVVLGLDLTNRAWTLAGDAVLPSLDPGVRPLAIAVLSLGILGGIIGLLATIRAGSGARTAGSVAGGLIGGAIGGVLLGVLTAVALGPRVGAAFGVLATLIAWPALAGLDVARAGIDRDALKARFYPGQTIETTKETIEWVRQRTPLGRKS